MNDFEVYKKLGEPDKKEKSEIWETAIGLQQVDGLKPSKYLIETAKSHIEGDITFDEVKEQISSYYREKPAKTTDEQEELEADTVSARIAEILAEKGFTLSFVEFVGIHKRLFDGLYDFAGTIRNYNIEKSEWVLDGRSVTYGNFPNIQAYLEYDFNEEKKFSFKGLSKEQTLKHIAEFTSRIWQIHAFGEGNTRTVAVFIIKYLRQFGFDIDNTLFAENSWYFRNALVRANFEDYPNGIYSTNEYLINFFENLLFDGKNILKNRYLHIASDTINDTINLKNDTINDTINKLDTILSFIKQNNKITSKEIVEKTGWGIATVKRHIKDLREQKIIERVGSNKTGYWKILK